MPDVENPRPQAPGVDAEKCDDWPGMDGIRTMPRMLGDVTAVLMAKDPAGGAAKRRLVAGGWTAAEANRVADVMLQCTARRLRAAAGRLVLAVTPDGTGRGLVDRLGLDPDEVIDQGGGDLGRRLDRVWHAAGPAMPVAFFGGDCPDVPDAMLSAIPVMMAGCDVAVGPTDDGGYWTLAATRHVPAVLAGIDWGSRHVYDQTRRQAAGAGLVVGALPLWHDVDHPGDVEALRARLHERQPAMPGRSIEADPLGWMAAQLDLIRPGNSPPESARS